MYNEGTLSGYRLRIKNPYYNHSLFQILLSAALAYLVYYSLSEVLGLTNPIIPELRENYKQAEYYPIILMLFIYGMFIINAGLTAIRNLFSGLRNVLSFFVPPGIPKNLDYQTNIRKLLDDQIIDTFEDQSDLQKVTRFFSKRFMYLTHAQKDFALRSVDIIRGWVFWLIVLVVPFFFGSFISEIVGTQIDYPFPTYLLLVVGILLFIRILVTMLLVPVIPEITIDERRKHLVDTGNPNNFHSFILRQFEAMRYENFKNRYYLEQQPIMGKIQSAHTDVFSGHVLVETQPIPIEKRFNLPAFVMDASGAVLIVIGFIVVMFLTQSSLQEGIQEPDLMVSQFIVIFLIIITAGTAISNGNKLMNQAQQLYERIIYRSHLIFAQMQGSYTSSTIGLGDGRGGQLFSKRESIQSDTDVLLTSTCLLTETEEFEGERSIISAITPPDFLQKLDVFESDLREFRDSSGKLASIDLQANGYTELSDANVIIEGKHSAAREVGKEMVQKQLPNETVEKIGALIEPVAGRELVPETSKECPKCKEIIKLKALVCRYCGHEFLNEI